MPRDFRSSYGPTALIAGASEGLGAAFADAIAARGLDLVLVARRRDALEHIADELRRRHRVTVHAAAMDLGTPEAVSAMDRIARDFEIGLVVYNAAHSPIGAFVSRERDDLLRVVDVNVRGPIAIARTFAPAMVARGRGGIVLMSSLAGDQGTPRVATYAASKAFATVLAEGLWHELRPHGVDVLVSCAGAIRTPGFDRASSRAVPGTLSAAVVAERTLAALARGPRVTPGWLNRVVAFIVRRLLPRRLAVALMAASTRNLT
jgi:short-subunit dehydrogenase